MPTFYTQPEITTRGLQQPDLLDTYARLMQLQAIAERRQLGRIEQEEASLRLEELRRASKEGAAVRGAMAAGVRRAPQISNEVPTLPEFRGVLGPTSRVMAQSPQPSATFDRQAMLASLAQSDPSLVQGAEQQFASQDMKMQEEMLKVAEAATKLDTAQLGNAKTRMDMMGSLAQSVILNPNSYQSAKATAERMGFIQPGQLPEQFTPELLPQLEAWANQTMQVKDILQQEETRRHNRATEQRKPVPGVDVPLPPEVVKQKKDIAQAGRAQPTAIVQTVDAEGRPVTKIVPRTIGSEFAVAPTAQMRQKEAQRGTVSTAVQAVKQLGDRVVSEKTGAVQKAVAAGRSIEATLGDDPEFRAYQDARVALAGNLAVLQQGSRPSDADIRAVWLPLVPDAFRDTKNSAALKWKLIDQMSGFDQQPQTAGPAIGTVEGGYRFKGGDPADSKNWEKVK